MPAYPWERIERGSRAHGEARAWEAWLGRVEAFARSTGLGDAVVMPMRATGEDRWKGAVLTSTGERRRLAYSIEKGLWFPGEGEG